MSIIAGSLTARLWRVTESLPAHFDEIFERNLKRHAFKPVSVEHGRLRSLGWVNIRQPLDANPTMKKTMMGGVIALGLRVDELRINQKLFRATYAEEIAKALRAAKGHGEGEARLTDEQRLVIEDKVRQDLLKAQAPNMSVYEAAWHLESGLVVFGASSNKLNGEFADLFSETFNLSLEAQFPYIRAAKWAKRQRAERELEEVLPAPFSPQAPVDVIEVTMAGDDE